MIRVSALYGTSSVWQTVNVLIQLHPVINMTTDSNDICLVSWGSVSSVQLSITHYW